MGSASTWGTALAVVLVAYFCGSIPWGFLIGKFNGLDLRRHGSGNIGATNVRRVLGRDWGMLCFALDFLKGLVPVLIAGHAVGGESAAMAEYVRILAGAAAVVGHIWPFTLGFRGGKGMSTTVGVLLAIAPGPIVIAVLGWLLVFQVSRFVSLATLAAAVLLPLSGGILHALRGRPSLPALVLLLGLAVLIVARHRGNLTRLRQGTEYRFERPRRGGASG